MAEEICDDGTEHCIAEILQSLVVLAPSNLRHTTHGTVHQRRPEKVDVTDPESENVLEITPNLSVRQ